MKHLTRGSSADLHLQCAGSIGYTGTEYSEDTIVARTGTAVHEAMARVVEGRKVAHDYLQTKFGNTIDQDVARIAFATGRKIWGKLSEVMPGALSERRIVGRTTEGTADVLWLALREGSSPQSIAILDWKLGMSEDHHINQLGAYALAAVDRYGRPADGYVTVVEVWLMKGTYAAKRLSLVYLEHLRSRFEAQHMRAREQFNPGDWCKYCPFKTMCGERRKYIRAAGEAIAGIGCHVPTRKALARLWDKSKALERALAEYKKAVRAEVATEGPLELGDGRVIDLHEQEKIVFDDAASVIDMVRPYADLNKLVSISKSSLEKAIRAKAPRGKAASTVRQTLASLEEEGLISKSTTLRLEAKKMEA